MWAVDGNVMKSCSIKNRIGDIISVCFLLTSCCLCRRHETIGFFQEKLSLIVVSKTLLIFYDVARFSSDLHVTITKSLANNFSGTILEL